MTSPTHYETLEVSENASEEVIKGAYRFLSQKWHPDRNPAQREQQIKELSRSELVACISGFTFCAVCIVAASVWPGVRYTLFGSYFLWFLLALCVVPYMMERTLAARRRTTLEKQQPDVLARMYEQYKRKKKAHVTMGWIWTILVVILVLSYISSIHASPMHVSMPMPATAQPAPLIVQNQCNRAVSVAVHYRDAVRWQTEGMFTFEPGENSRLGRVTSRGGEPIQPAHGHIYYFATSVDGAYRWAGDEANPAHKPVFVGDRLLHFRSVQLDRDDQNAFVLALTCGSQG